MLKPSFADLLAHLEMLPKGTKIPLTSDAHLAIWQKILSQKAPPITPKPSTTTVNIAPTKPRVEALPEAIVEHSPLLINASASESHVKAIAFLEELPTKARRAMIPCDLKAKLKKKESEESLAPSWLILLDGEDQAHAPLMEALEKIALRFLKKGGLFSLKEASLFEKALSLKSRFFVTEGFFSRHPKLFAEAIGMEGNRFALKEGSLFLIPSKLSELSPSEKGIFWKKLCHFAGENL